MARRTLKNGRRSSSPFLALPAEVINSEAFLSLSSHAVRLLIDLGAQYRGHNNGDLCGTWSIMRQRGWRSPGTLERAKKELIEAGFIEQTRWGGRNRCSLYALAWRGIDECDGKLDVDASASPSRKWRRADESGN